MKKIASKPVLDVCCGPKLFWFDRNDPRAVFLDKRILKLTTEKPLIIQRIGKNAKTHWVVFLKGEKVP